MLYRKFQTYTACSVPQCAAKRNNKFYHLTQTVNKGEEEVLLHEQSQGASVAEAAQCVLCVVLIFFFQHKPWSPVSPVEIIQCFLVEVSLLCLC